MSTGRVLPLVRLATVLQWRHQLVALVAAVTLAWVGLLLALPADAAVAVAPWLLVLETALLGTTLVGALILFERGQGVLAALATSPAGPGEYLASKLAPMTVLVLASAAPIALAGRIGALELVPVLVAVGLTAVLSMLVAVTVAVRSWSAMAFMIALPLVLLPLLVPPVLHAAGLGHPLLYAVPTTGAMDVVQAGYRGQPALPAAALAWVALACLPATIVARRQLHRFATGPPTPSHNGSIMEFPVRVARRVAGKLHDRPPSGGPVRAFLRTDLVSARRDPSLIMIGLSSLLLALAVRLGYPPLHRWLADAHGFDLTSYRPLLLAAVVLLPAHTFGMVGALLVLDDVDDRAVVALRTSPLTMPRYLAYRIGLVAVVALAGTAVVGALSGLAPLDSWLRLAAACLLAGLVAPVTMAATLAMARSKVEGVAAIKLLGLPLYAPLAAWWLTGPVSWLFAVLPTWWVAQTLWNSWAYALGGAALLAGMLALLTRRALATLAPG